MKKGSKLTNLIQVMETARVNDLDKYTLLNQC